MHSGSACPIAAATSIGTTQFTWLLELMMIGAATVVARTADTERSPESAGARRCGYTGGVPDGVVAVTAAGPRFCPKIEMIPRGDTEVALRPAPDSRPVPVWIGRRQVTGRVHHGGDAGLGWAGHVENGVVTGACDGLFGGAGLVTASVHAIG